MTDTKARIIPRFRLVVLDVDGTLLDDNLRISERNRAAIARAAAAGVRLALATGRPYPSARSLALDLGVDPSLICYNGALVRHARTAAPVFHRTIDPPIAARVVQLLEQRGLEAWAWVDDRLCVGRVTEGVRWLRATHYLECRTVGDLAAFLAGTANRPGPAPTMIVTHPSPEETREVISELQREIGPAVEGHRPNEYALNITGRGARKEHAVRRLAATLGIDRAAVLAVGNGENDAAMLRWAGCGVAVANAAPAARAAADWVSTDNNCDGVAVALERLLFGE